MANNIGVRSPQFITVGNTGGVRFELNVTINGTLRYELVKLVDDSATFEIAELVRDYINISYNGTMPTATAYTTNSNGYIADVGLGWTAYTNTAGTGTPSYTGGVSLVAYDAYKFFDETGYNYSLPSSEILITADTVWLPEGESMTVYYTNATVLSHYEIGTTHPEGDILLTNYTLNVRRYPCSKHDPTKLVFVNRFGVLQELWFFGRTTESSRVKSEQYKSANISANGSYNRYEHQFKKFDLHGKKNYVINSGLVSEGYNDSINELLLSEQVWLHIDNDVVPVNVLTSDVSYKTSLNDKLVQYTLELEQAYDLISTMR